MSYTKDESSYWLTEKHTMKKSESNLQRECVRWFRYAYPDKMLFAIGNGGKRNVITAAILKAEGVLSGVWDLLLMEPQKNDGTDSYIPYHGLWIEMKYGKNGLTENQKLFKEKAEKRNYKCVICKTFDEFKKEIDEYLIYV